MLEIIYLTIGIVYLLLIGLVLKKNINSIINVYFLISLVGIFIWHATLYLYIFVDLGGFLLFVGRLNYAIGPIFSVGLLGFYYYFPVKTLNCSSRIIWSVWIITLLLSAITLGTPLINESETMTEAGPVVTLGPLYTIYLLHVFFLPVITLILGWRKYLSLKGLSKLKFQYSFWVFVPSVIAFLIMNLILPIFGIINQFVYSPIFMLPIALSSFYAIAKYRFLDIRMILARTVVFVFFGLIISILYYFLVFIVLHVVLGIQIDFYITSIGIAVALFAAVSFHPIEKWLRKISNFIFYKNYYSSEELIAELTNIMARTIRLDQMTTSLLALLLEKMNILQGAFLIMKDSKVEDFDGIGYKKGDFNLPELGRLLVKYLDKKDILVFDELHEGKVKSLMHNNDISIVIPIKVNNVIKSILILGDKQSGEMYTLQDLNLLNIFAPEAGIAIQNAISYEHIRKFNIILEKKVDERTCQLKKAHKRELAKTQEMVRMKDEFVYLISHELSTPITAINGFLELVAMEVNKLPANMRDYIKYVSDGANHLTNLVNDLLEVARSESGTLKVHVVPGDLTEVIMSSIKEVEARAKKRHIKIITDMSSDLGLAYFDFKKLKEVLCNLLTNAVKYNKEGGEIRIKVSPNIGKKIKLEVKDTGYGIPKKQQSQVFQKFFRAYNDKTANVEGTGLGLFVTKMLVEKMGGKISFTSVVNKGTTFSVILPAK